MQCPSVFQVFGPALRLLVSALLSSMTSVYALLSFKDPWKQTGSAPDAQVSFWAAAHKMFFAL